MAIGVSCSSNETGESWVDAGRPRRADEGGLGERGLSWTDEGRPNRERRTEEAPPGLSRMLASDAAGWGEVGRARGGTGLFRCSSRWLRCLCPRRHHAAPCTPQQQRQRPPSHAALCK